MSLLLVGKEQYIPYQYKSEGDFEHAVEKLADFMFGPSSIYLNVKKRIRSNELIGIPDGYLIDMTDPGRPQLFIVEIETSSHDIFRHIGIQLLKFVTCFEDARHEIRSVLMAQIQSDKKSLERLQKHAEKSGSRNIDSYLESAVGESCRALVIIDEAKPELNQILEKINADISVLEVKTYVGEDGSPIYQYDTLFDEFEDEPSSEPKAHLDAGARLARRTRRAKCDTIVVPAREEGFKKCFLGEHQWYEIRIGPAMKERIKYIAAYQVAPISAVTHIAEVQEIKPYKDTGKYLVVFKKPAEEISHIPSKEGGKKPQGPVYVQRDILLKSKSLDEALS